MMKINKSALYYIIFLEGYVVLATELLAIRQLIPFVGSGTETVAIIIAAVLMPLSFGYYVGGNFKSCYMGEKMVTIRYKLIGNVIIAGLFIAIGLSYLSLNIFFVLLNNAGIGHRVIQTALFSLLFIVYPTFLLGQTVPLISNYFSRMTLSKTTGIILSFSTVGSFFGATLSTLVLMGTIGVHNVVIFNVILLLVVVVILTKRLMVTHNIIMVIVVGLAIILNGNHVMAVFNIVEDNAYNTISVFDGDEGGTKELHINRSFSAKYSARPEERHAHIRFLEKNYLEPILKNNKTSLNEPKSMLIIGAGGFIFGIDDTFNQYTFVDIDKALKDVVETYFLPEKLSKNKKFYAIPARSFFHQVQQKYDFIFLDVFTNVVSIPFQLITKEFFYQVKDQLADNGILVFNVITSPNFNDNFSVKIDNTLRSVFGAVNRQVISEFNGWQDQGEANVIYSYYHKKQVATNYTDDINTYFLDR